MKAWGTYAEAGEVCKGMEVCKQEGGREGGLSDADTRNGRVHQDVTIPGTTLNMYGINHVL